MSAYTILLLTISLLSSTHSDSTHPPWAGPKLDLIHRDSLNMGQHNETARIKRLTEMVHRDNLRKQSFILPGKIERDPTAMMLLTSSDFVNGSGEYFVGLAIGKPPQTMLLAMDTASELTWVNCSYKGYNKAHGPRVFWADNSESFRPISCSSGVCREVRDHGIQLDKCRLGNCSYIYSYKTGTSLGFLAHETATLSLTDGSTTELEAILMGCTVSSTGLDNFMHGVDGVLGLGYSNISFQAKASIKFGNTFSYCIVDNLSPKNELGSLFFGPLEELNLATDNKIQHTELIVGPFYGVKVESISVNGEIVNISAKTWDPSNGRVAILDTGTTGTYFPTDAYVAVLSALDKTYWNFSVLIDKPFDYCYNTTGVGRLPRAPELKIVFEGGAIFLPHESGYVVEIDENMTCRALGDAGLLRYATFGNMVQQRFVWEFDTEGGRVRFARSECSRSRA